MSSEQKQAFWLCQEQLFGMTLQDVLSLPSSEMTAGSEEPASAISLPTSLSMSEPSSRQIWILVGIATDSAAPAPFRRLLDDLRKLKLQQSNCFIEGIKVIVVENGPRSYHSCEGDDEYMTSVAISRLQLCINEVADRSDLRCNLITIEQQIRDCASSSFFPSFCKPSLSQRASIAETRSLVQSYMHKQAQRMHRESPSCIPVAWIIDDDKRVSIDTVQQAMNVYEAREPAAVLGVDACSPPLPEAFVIRCQMVDFNHSLLMMLSAIREGNGFEDEGMSSMQIIENKLPSRSPEFYHDLSTKHWDHLKHPCVSSI